MLNLKPNNTNNLIIYADTVSVGSNLGNFFTLVFTNSYSKQTFSVAANVVRRNTRFVELEINLVGVDGLNDPINGDIYLYPEGNYEYIAFNTNAPTITFESPLSCAVWSTDEDFWNFAQTVWNVCQIEFAQIDRGQAFLYAEDPCEHEVEFVPYTEGNEILDAIVYVTNTPLYQFPCTILAGTVYTVAQNTVTYCQTITLETGATLNVPTPITLTQKYAPWGYC
jgi:hypothetical protein